MTKKTEGSRVDIYTRITEKIVAELEKGVRPWMRPWSVGNAAGRVTRPLRHNGEPYSGMNVLAALVGGDGAWLHLAVLDDLQTGDPARSRRP